MVDISTHRILDMIDSREYEDVKKWLETYPNIQIVSRDGSLSYRNAIADAHPSAKQISDRFHLLKNLTTYGTEYLKKHFKQHIKIQVENYDAFKINNKNISLNMNKNRKLTLKEKYELIEQYLKGDNCKTELCKSVNMDIRTCNRLMSMTSLERAYLFKTKKMQLHEDKVQMKINRINDVRELKKIGYSNREISRRTGFSKDTVRKYLDENISPIYASYGKKKNGKLTPFLKDIDTYLEKGIMGSVIEEKIRELGYKGSSSNIRCYITDWKQKRKFYYDRSRSTDKKIDVIERKNVLKLLFQPLEKVKSISQIQFLGICEQYPCFKKVYNIIWEFKKILANKNLEELNDWIGNAKRLAISEIDSFVSGIERDLNAVENAIKYKYSNGLCEGSINKLKVTKRIMYGRCNFLTLRTKTLLLENAAYFN